MFDLYNSINGDSMKAKSIGKSTEGSLNLREFSALYETLAKRAAKEAEENIVYWLTYLQIYIESFWITPLGLSEKELEQFGYISDVKQVLQDVKMSEAIDTIIYIGSNQAMLDQKMALSLDAYRTAMEMYQKKCKNPDYLKDRVIKTYAGKEHKYAMKLQTRVSDETLAAKMMKIRNSFIGLSKKEKQHIKKSLCSKKGLEECLVFDIADLHKKYLKINDGA